MKLRVEVCSVCDEQVWPADERTAGSGAGRVIAPREWYEPEYFPNWLTRGRRSCNCGEYEDGTGYFYPVPGVKVLEFDS